MVAMNGVLDATNWSHTKVVAYIESRGGTFERVTLKGKWRYLIFGKYPVEIPPPHESYSARQWGNVRELVRRDIDRAHARAGERPDEHTQPELLQQPPAPAPPAEPAPAPPAPAPAQEDDSEPAARATPARGGYKLTFQPCPVKDCDRAASGKHLWFHKQRGELPRDFSLRNGRKPGPSERAAAREAAGRVQARQERKVERKRAEVAATVALVVGPTSRQISELQERVRPHVDAVRAHLQSMDEELRTYRGRIDEELQRLEELTRDVLKVAADQETTLRLVTRERDDALERWNGVAAQVLSRTTNPMYERKA